MSKIKLRTETERDIVICSGCDLFDGLYCKMAWGKPTSISAWTLRPGKKCPLHQTEGTFIIDPFKGVLK